MRYWILTSARHAFGNQASVLRAMGFLRGIGTPLTIVGRFFSFFVNELLPRLVGEPISQFATAPGAVLGAGGCLVLALGRTGRAFHANVKMVIVPFERAHLGQPCALVSGPVAQCLLDRRMDENAGYLFVGCGPLDQAGMSSVQRFGLMRLRSSVIRVADLVSRSLRDSVWSGMGVSQMSASRPAWCDA